MDYYYADANGSQQGPVPAADLLSRGVRPETLIWADGMPNWQRADAIPELQPLFQPPVQAPPPPNQPQSSSQQNAPPPYTPAQYAQPPSPLQYGTPTQYPGADKKIAAGICGILLGAFGVHKFILGFTGAGIIMLLVSVFGCCFLHGLGGLAMGIIGLIEGIIYLTKSDAEFYQLYIVQKKSWF